MCCCQFPHLICIIITLLVLSLATLHSMMGLHDFVFSTFVIAFRKAIWILWWLVLHLQASVTVCIFSLGYFNLSVIILSFWVIPLHTITLDGIACLHFKLHMVFIITLHSRVPPQHSHFYYLFVTSLTCACMSMLVLWTLLLGLACSLLPLHLHCCALVMQASQCCVI